MLVESFECEETSLEANQPEVQEEALSLIETLGLEGQKQLISTGDKKERCPYRKIREDEKFVYRTLCPREKKFEEYDHSPIPLRVLQIAQHFKSLNICDYLEVWSAEGMVKDPVLVAKESKYEGEIGTFILARWGEELDEWGVLVNKAVEIWREKVKSQIAKAKAQIVMTESQIDSCGIADACAHSGGISYYGF